MGLDGLLEKYRKKEVKPGALSLVKTAERAEAVYDLSEKKNITTELADAEILSGELLESNKSLEDSPMFQKMDGLLDVFDPSEPPKGGEGQADPMGEIMKAEMKVMRETAKWGTKAMSYVFSPIDRSFKFMTNALMYDPLTKSVAGPIKRLAIHIAKEQEVLRRIREAGAVGSPEEINEIEQEVDSQISEMIKQVNADTEEDGVEVADFLKSGKNALKSLVPWPGYADDVKSFGGISADSFERIVGNEAPVYYAPVGDIALQTTAIIGIAKLANSAQTAKDAASLAKGAKLTRSEVNAIKKLHKQASKAAKVPIKAIGVPAADDAMTATQKLIGLIKEAKPLRSQKSLLVHKNRQNQARKLMQVQKNVRGSRLVHATKGAMKGKSATPDFSPLNAGLTPVEIDTLFDMVNTSQLGMGFNKGRGVLSLDKLLKGNLITKGEIANLEAVFGTGLTKALFKKGSIVSMVQDLSFDVINTPRALLASADLSAGGRQGIIFSVSHPIASMKAMGRSVKAALSTKYADGIEKVTKSNSWGKLADRFGVHSSPMGFAAKIGEKEEIYMSRIAENLPFGIGKVVAASERAFTTFLNQQRREVFILQAKKWIRRGITPKNNPKSFQDYANFVNHATGRGSLDQLHPGALTAMNAVFFSPRFQVSRVQVMGDLIRPTTTLNARKVIARDLAEFYATGMGIMGMAKAGGAEVEMDYRSSDFGKIKVGNTRYNYWGAFQSLVRVAGQMYSGEIKQTGTGKLKNKARDEILLNFLRTKLAPVPSRAWDVAVGETFLGDPVELTGKFVGKASYESLVPLFIQDSVDAWRFQGADAQFPLSATLAFTGIGVQTWELAPFAELELAKDSLSRQTFGKNYDELSYSEAKELDINILVDHPGIVDLEHKVKFENNSVNYLKRQAQEMRKSERFVEKHINKELLQALNDMQIRVGGIERVFGNWRLDDGQYKEYQERVAKNINELFEETKLLWDAAGANEKYELMTRILSGAKTLSAREMKIGEMK